MAASGERSSYRLTGRVYSLDPCPECRVTVAGGTRPIERVRLRISGSAVVPVYSLDINREPDADDIWTPNRPDRAGLRGVRSSLWLATRARDLEVPLLPSEEHCATQLAIWSFTNGISLAEQDELLPRIRERAIVLADAAESAPTDVQLGAHELDLQISEYSVDSKWITFAIHLHAGAAFDLSSPQQLLANGAGAWVPVWTGRRSDLSAHREPGTIRVREMQALGTQTALVRIERGANAVRLAASWEVQVQPPVLLLPEQGGPPLLTSAVIPAHLSTQHEMTASTLPGVLAMTERKISAVLRKLPLPIRWLALLAAAYAIVNYSATVEWVVGSAAAAIDSIGEWIASLN